MRNVTLQRAAEEEWVLIEAVDRQPTTRHRKRFQQAVWKTVQLLAKRRLWAQVSSALNTTAVKRNPRLQQALRRIRVDLTRAISKTGGMFSHLERVKGRLVYRRSP